MVVLRRDFEAWLQSHAVRPSSLAVARVEERLAHEARADVLNHQNASPAKLTGESERRGAREDGARFSQV
jgi:hypothetical protein